MYRPSLERQDDSTLVQGTLDGDARCFEVLVGRYQRRLFGLVRHYIRSAVEVEDIVQDTFIKLASALPSLDPDRIAVAGGSAGGYLALMVGLSDDKDGPGGDPAAQHSAKVSGVIDMYGVVNFSKHGKGVVPGVSAAEQAAYLPENQCDPQDPPVLILHGTADTTVDISQSEDMAKALRAAKVSHEYVVVEGAPHTFDLHPKGKRWKRTGVVGGVEVNGTSDQPDVTKVTLEFLARTIGK